MILYKYKNNSLFTEKIFTEKKVWLSNAANLNDPFECTIGEIAKDWINEEIKKLKNGHMGGFISGAMGSIKSKLPFYNLSPKQTKEFLSKFSKKGFDEQYKTVREFIHRKTGKELSNPEDIFKNLDEQLNNVGIFSLSETDDNELLWAYYAESSTGIALGFEVTEGNKLANKEFCIKVDYSDELPTFKGNGFQLSIVMFADKKSIQKISFTDDTFRQAISTKKIKWSHENEWRYIEEKSGNYNYPGELKELIFGLKCPKEKREYYVKLLDENFKSKIDLYEIVILPNSNILTKQIYTP
jgi:hypothetical protein